MSATLPYRSTNGKPFGRLFFGIHTVCRKAAQGLPYLLLSLIFFSGFQTKLQAQTPKTGEGLYVKQCTEVEVKKFTLGEKNPFTKVYDTNWYTEKENICTMVPLTDAYPKLSKCDTIAKDSTMKVDSTYIGSTTEGGTTVDNYRKDTTYCYTFRVQCVQVDTFYTYDTAIRKYRVVVRDTTTSYDTLVLVNPERPTDTTFLFCPHVENVYNPYTELSRRYQDSITVLQAQLAALKATWPADLRIGTSNETLAQYYTDENWVDIVGLSDHENDSCKELFTKHVLDSLNKIAPLTPANIQARIDLYTQLAAKYNALRIATQHYHIDSVNVISTIHLSSGAKVSDTMTVRTIPLLYTKQPDTTVRQDEHVLIWAGSPHLPMDSNTHRILAYGDAKGDTVISGTPTPYYVDITWDLPVNAADRSRTFNGRTIAPGFSPATLQFAADRPFTEPVHLVTYVAELLRAGAVPSANIPAFLSEDAIPQNVPLDIAGGAPWFPTNGPLYIADTLDGDSLLFPIHITATRANMERFPSHPDYMCEYNDTVKVYVVKGYRIGGSVSYAGLWLPVANGVPSPLMPDIPTTDGDLFTSQLRHLPIANAEVILQKLDGTVLERDTSDVDGYYQFKDRYMEGTYVLTARSPQKESVYGDIGLNGNDAVWVQNYVAFNLTTSELPENTNKQYSMWWWASNVNLSTAPVVTQGLDGNDAAAIQNKVAQNLGAANKYSADVGAAQLDDWAYSVDTIYLMSDTLFYVRGVMRGDADRNYYDGGTRIEMSKRNKKESLEQYGAMEVNEDIRRLDFPVISLDSGWMKGFQIFLYYNTSKVEPLGASLPENLDNGRTNLAQNVKNDLILTTWVSKDNQYINVGDTLLVLNLILPSKPVKNFSSYFKKDKTNYVVSDTAARIVPWNVSMPLLNINKVEKYKEDRVIDLEWKPWVEEGDTIYQIPDNETPLVAQGSTGDEPSHIISVIPNPIVFWGDVTYFVSHSSLVNLKLYSLLGKPVLTFVEAERQLGLYRLSMNMQTLPSGVYILRLETTRHGRTEFDVAKIVIKR